MIEITKATPESMNYVYSTVLSNLRRDGFNRYMRDTYFYDMMNGPINKIIEDSTVYIGVNKEHKDFVQGFLIVHNDAVVYAYTRNSLRRMGIFKKLFKHHFKEWKKHHSCYFINNNYANIFGKKVEYKPKG